MPDKSYLYQEIHEQPEVLHRFLDSQTETARRLAAAIRSQEITHVVIAARGTSDNAGRYAKYLFGALNSLPVALATPSLFSVYRQPPSLRHSLVLGISQSGKSPDIVSVLTEARRQGALTAVVTNTVESALAQQGDYVIDLSAGSEHAIASTKTYTSELAAMALLSATLAGDQEMMSTLRRVPEAVADTLQMNALIARHAPRYRYMRHAVVIGRGYNYATAFEMALKLKELTYAIVESYSSADFLHGPIAVIEPGFPAFVIAPSGKMQPQIELFVHSLREKQAEIVIISDVPQTLALAHIPLALPSTVPEWLSPLTAIVPGQLLAMHLAHVKGYDIDSPRGLKKVTETH